jgi:hypothetical protein
LLASALRCPRASRQSRKAKTEKSEKIRFLDFCLFEIGSGANPHDPAGGRGSQAQSLSFASSTQPNFQNWGPYICLSGRWLLCFSAMNTNSRNWGPIGLSNPIAYRLNRQGEGCNSAIGQFQLGHWFNANQCPQYNEANSISRISQGSRD